MEDREAEVTKVNQLGKLMQGRLDDKAPLKGRLGWQSRPFSDLLDDVRRHTAQLSEAASIMQAMGQLGSDKYAGYRTTTIKECVDLANSAMMVVDRLQAFEGEGKVNGE